MVLACLTTNTNGYELSFNGSGESKCSPNSYFFNAFAITNVSRGDFGQVTSPLQVDQSENLTTLTHSLTQSVSMVGSRISHYLKHHIDANVLIIDLCSFYFVTEGYSRGDVSASGNTTWVKGDIW